MHIAHAHAYALLPDCRVKSIRVSEAALPDCSDEEPPGPQDRLTVTMEQVQGIPFQYFGNSVFQLFSI